MPDRPNTIFFVTNALIKQEYLIAIIRASVAKTSNIR